MSCVTIDTLLTDHPAAIELALTLEREGFTLQYRPEDDSLTVAPSTRLNDDIRRQIREHLPVLKTLYMAIDDEVVKRRAAFEFDLAHCHARGVLIPGFLYRAHTPYVKGQCFSCGDQLPELAWRRCWRCSVAWRLACRVLVRPDVAEALDSARMAS